MVVVETHLAEGDYAGVIPKLSHGGQKVIGHFLCFVGMESAGCVDAIRVKPGELNGTACIFEVDAERDDTVDPGGIASGENLIKPVAKLRER